MLLGIKAGAALVPLNERRLVHGPTDGPLHTEVPFGPSRAFGQPRCAIASGLFGFVASAVTAVIIGASFGSEASAQTIVHSSGAPLQSLGIESPERLGKGALFDEVIANRLDPRRGADKPLAVLIFAKSDHNGAFTAENYKALIRAYRVVYFEVAGETELLSSLRGATKDRPAQVLVIAGHGRTSGLWGISLSGPPDQFHDHRQLDSTDKALMAELGTGVAAGGHVVLDSCYAAGRWQLPFSVLDAMAQQIPHAHHYGSHQATGIVSPILDGDGLFLGAAMDQSTVLVRPDRSRVLLRPYATVDDLRP